MEWGDEARGLLEDLHARCANEAQAHHDVHGGHGDRHGDRLFRSAAAITAALAEIDRRGEVVDACRTFLAVYEKWFDLNCDEIHAAAETIRDAVAMLDGNSDAAGGDSVTWSSDSIRDGDECRVCGADLHLDDGCEWPDGGPICYGCLVNERDWLVREVETLAKAYIGQTRHIEMGSQGPQQQVFVTACLPRRYPGGGIGTRTVNVRDEAEGVAMI